MTGVVSELGFERSRDVEVDCPGLMSGRGWMSGGGWMSYLRV